jgi:large subunit ribosomal protein L4
MKRAALRSALSDAAQAGKLAVVQNLAFDEPKTKDAVAVLESLGLVGRVLVIIDAPDEAMEKSFRNIGNVKIDYPGNLSTYDLLFADRVLFTSEALDALTGETTEPFVLAEEPEEAEQEQPDETTPHEEPAETEAGESGDRDQEEPNEGPGDGEVES